MMKEPIRKILRNGYDFFDENGRIKANICERNFVLYVQEDASDVQVCVNFLRGYCYRHFAGGSLEQVLEDVVALSYIRTPMAVITAIQELRKIGVKGRIFVEVEYAEGLPAGTLEVSAAQATI